MATTNDIPHLMTGARFVAQHISSPERINRTILGIESNLQDDPAVVFDFAKTLIETTCKTLLKERGHPIDEDQSVQKLAKATLRAVIQIPDGHPDPQSAKSRLEMTFNSLTGVVQGLGELRNREGEIAHGKDSERVSLTSCHAEFAARAADAVVKFLVESNLGSEVRNELPKRLPYSANANFNDYVDELHLPIVIFSAQYKPSEVLYQMDPQTYSDALADFDDEKVKEDE